MIFGRLWEDRDENPEAPHGSVNGNNNNHNSNHNIHDSRTPNFRRAAHELRQPTIIEELE
jgi:hypothetical protein